MQEMSYRFIATDFIVGDPDVPGYAFRSRPAGMLELEQVGDASALVDVDGNVVATGLHLTGVGAERVFISGPNGEVTVSTFPGQSPGNASYLVSGKVDHARLAGDYVGVGNVTAGTISAADHGGNLDAALVVSGTLDDARLQGAYTANALTAQHVAASTARGNIHASSVVEGRVHPDRLAGGSYTLGELTLTGGNVTAAAVSANANAASLVTGTVSNDRLVGAYTMDSVASTALETNVAVVSGQVPDRCLVSAGPAVVSSATTPVELGHIRGMSGNSIQVQLDEIHDGLVVGNTIKNLDATQFKKGVLSPQRLSGAYTFQSLALSDHLEVPVMMGNLSATHLASGTVDPARIVGDYHHVGTVSASGTITAASVRANLDASDLVAGHIEDAQLAGSYACDGLTTTSNITAAWCLGNVHADRLVAGTIPPDRIDFDPVPTSILSPGSVLGAPTQPWDQAFVGTATVDDVVVDSSVSVSGGAFLQLDLRTTETSIIPAAPATYTMGTPSTPWASLHATDVVIDGTLIVGDGIVDQFGNPLAFDLENVPVTMLPKTPGLSFGNVSNPWDVRASLLRAADMGVDGVTTGLFPQTSASTLGAPDRMWANVYSANVSGAIDGNRVGDVWAQLETVSGGTIEALDGIRLPDGVAAFRFLDVVPEGTLTGLGLRDGSSPGGLDLSIDGTPATTVVPGTLTQTGSIVPSSNGVSVLGGPDLAWSDLVAAAVSTPAGTLGIDPLTTVDVHASGTVSAAGLAAQGTISAPALAGTLDAGTFLTGTLASDRFGAETYTVSNVQVDGTLDVTGTLTCGNLAPATTLVADLGSSTSRFRDLYVSNNSIWLGTAALAETDGAITVSSNVVVTDGISGNVGSRPEISNVVITTSDWVPLDDTAVPLGGGFCLVHGRSFGASPLVRIGTTNALSTAYVNDGQLRVQVPAKESGSYDVHVIRQDTKTATLPSGLTFSERVVWVTQSALGNVSQNQAFSIPLVATSDSTVSFANVTSLPPQTTIDHVTGNLTGNITSVGTSTLFSFDVDAVDEELQNSTKTFLLQLLVLLINGTGYTDASWTPLTQTALDSNVSSVFWTIDGQGMNQVTDVAVDGTSATSFTAVDDSTLRVTGPQKPRGTYDVTVQTAGTSKVLANAVFFSDVPTWVTPTALGNVEEGVPFSFPLEAVSDSTISYANVDALPPSTALHPTSGVLAGTITGVAEDTQYNVGINATDAEYQLALRTFVLQYLAAMRVSKISSSWGHTLALSTTGRLVSWGANNYGQTGVGTAGGDVTLPVDITTRGTLAGRTITSISTGSMHSCALTSDGRVHCWGSNTNAECGQGNTTSPVLTPVIAGGAMTGRVITSIASGGQAYHVLALDDQGVVYAWGNNGAGECGQGNTVTPRSLPVAVTGGSLSGRTVQKITCGMNHSIALASDGTLHSWGSGFQGYLGTGNTTNQSLPQNITNNGSLSGKTITDVHARGAFTIVLCSDNSVHTFGGGSRLGDGTTNIRSLPVNITSNGSLGGKVITSISAGINIGHAIASDGSLHGWGIGGTDQQVGDGTQDTHLVPVNISSSGALGNQSITRLCEAGYHTFVIVDDGKGVVAWGRNTNYQVGDGTNTTPRPTPLDVTQNILPRFSLEILKIAAGYGHTLALSNQGRLVGWGQNISGKTGVGNTTTPVTLPVDITVRGSLAGHVITDIACGGEHSVAVTDNGVVHCWGDNTTGQCGQGNTTSPQLVPVVTGAALAGKTVIMVACGTRGSHTLALDDGGVVYAWGQNSSGECGQGHTTTPQTLPVAVTGGSLSGKVVTKISAGQGNSLALCSDGTVHSWGVGGNGENGNGSTSNQTLPINISFGSKTVVDIDASGRSCIALCSDFTVYTWGYNEWGECGTGNTTTRITSPTDITSNGSLSGKNIVGIYMSEVACHVLASDNSCHAWGYGGYASIGNGLLTPVNSLPLEITNVGALAGKTITRLSDAGLGQLVIVDGGKGVVAWGRNPNYEIGDGTNTQRPTPVDVTVNIMTKL